MPALPKTGLVVTLLIHVCLFSTATIFAAESFDKHNIKLYQDVVEAISKDDLSSLSKKLEFSSQFSFDNLKKNWSKAKVTMKKMYPPTENFIVIKQIRKGNFLFWVVESKQPKDGNKFFNTYKFTSKKDRITVIAVDPSGSYNFPDKNNLRESILNNIVNDIKKTD